MKMNTCRNIHTGTHTDTRTDVQAMLVYSSAGTQCWRAEAMVHTHTSTLVRSALVLILVRILVHGSAGAAKRRSMEVLVH